MSLADTQYRRQNGAVDLGLPVDRRPNTGFPLRHELNKGANTMHPVLRTYFPLLPFDGRTLSRVDSWFDRLFAEDGAGIRPATAAASFAVSVWEDENHRHVEAELPGVTDNDVDITVHDGVLKIRAERRPEEGRVYLYNGRSFGRFERSIVLPEAVDAENVEAVMSNGVLRIDLPKHPAARPRKITLKTS
jgi:HSP20 family protein